jgi:predicted KAP-like P-loop ATPase
MSTQLTFDWSDAVPDNNDLGPDRLGRAKYAEFLTSYLYGQNKDKSYVLNLNSGWGTGKTYFLKRWKHDLEKNHPIIYIDAWKDDHSADPFLSVVSSLITQLRARTDKSEESALSKGIEFSTRLIKHAAPIVIGSLSKKYIGLSYNDISPENEDVPSSGNNNNIDKVAQKLSSLLLSDHEKRISSIASLKETIKQWIEAVISQNNNASGGLVGPTFVIIDELDRCRPDYAVKTLEVVKHIFDIPGVFLLSQPILNNFNTLLRLFTEGSLMLRYIFPAFLIHVLAYKKSH